MQTFEQLRIGDVFNTKVARWVKVSSTEAKCVMSGVLPLGYVQSFRNDEEVILLQSGIPKEDEKK